MEVLLDVQELLQEITEALEEEEKDIATSACSRALLLPPTAEEDTAPGGCSTNALHTPTAELPTENTPS
jgi:hypothetical protein